MSIFKFQKRLSNRLLAWAILSMVGSFPLLLDTHKPIRDTGTQFLTWGFIDAIIAVLGKRSATEKEAKAIDQTKEAKKLRRILLINFGLDFIYLTTGAFLMQKDDGKYRGHGFGIIIQGGFLFFFDLYHAMRTPCLDQ